MTHELVDYVDSEFDRFISTLNQRLVDFDLEFRSGIEERERIKYFALVNTNSDDAAQKWSSYTLGEIEFLKIVVSLYDALPAILGHA
jgi:hypothetical protein